MGPCHDGNIWLFSKVSKKEIIAYLNIALLVAESLFAFNLQKFKGINIISKDVKLWFSIFFTCCTSKYQASINEIILKFVLTN